MLTSKNDKNAEIFNCNTCDFTCTKKSEWNRHLTTHKHIFNNPLTELAPKKLEHNCVRCKKTYKTRTGLWYHLKKCTISIVIDKQPKEITDLTNLVLEIVKSNTELQKQCAEYQKQCHDIQKQNQDLQKQMIDVCKNIQPATINSATINSGAINSGAINSGAINSGAINSNNISNSHNKTFNLQLFLNEECKDAMNLNDFVESVQLQMTDLEKSENWGISKAFQNSLWVN
jgi:hypothetical protein